MAIEYVEFKIVKSSAGQSAVASAAYQAGERLHCDRLDEDCSYVHKEEVIHREILLPKNAPEEYMDRETLWNAVESANKQPNAQYARKIMLALPNELSDEQNIELVQQYIKENFTDRGIAVDWAYHKNEGNLHAHLMMPLRGFTKDGKWAPMQKSAFKLDKDGNKVPMYEKDKDGNLVLDQNGQPIQKVRVRKGKGTEKLWERTTVAYNDWNTRERLYDWRREWVHSVNHHLEINGHSKRLKEYIEPSKKKKDPDLMIMKHEGYAARKMEKQGIISDVCEYNRQAKQHNDYINHQKDEIELILLLLIQLLLNLLTHGQVQIIPDYMLQTSYLDTARKKADTERSIYGESNISRVTNSYRYYAGKPASAYRREQVAARTTEANNRRLQLTSDGLRDLGKELHLPEETKQSIDLITQFFSERGLSVSGSYNGLKPSELCLAALDLHRKLQAALQKPRKALRPESIIEPVQALPEPEIKAWKPKTQPVFESKLKKTTDLPDR